MAENNFLLGLKIMDLLRKYSDRDHTLTQKDIVEMLWLKYNTKVDRKTIGRNMETLIAYDEMRGEHIRDRALENEDGSLAEENKGVKRYYYKSDFDAGEMRILYDSILSNRHISMNYSKDLIDRISSGNIYQKEKGIRDIAFYDSYYKQHIPNLFLNTEEILYAIEKHHDLRITVGEYDANLNLVPGRETRVSPIQLCMYEQVYYLIAVPRFSLMISRKIGGSPSIYAYPVADLTSVRVLKHSDNSAIRELPEIRRKTDFSDVIEGFSYTERGVISGRKTSMTFVIPMVFLKDVVRRFEKNIRVSEIPGSVWSEHVGDPRECPLVKVVVRKTNTRAMERFMNEHRAHIYILDPVWLNYQYSDETKRRTFEETVKELIPEDEQGRRKMFPYGGILIARSREVEASGLSDEEKKQMIILLRKMFRSGIKMKEYMEKEHQLFQERMKKRREEREDNREER